MILYKKPRKAQAGLKYTPVDDDVTITMAPQPEVPGQQYQLPEFKTLDNTTSADLKAATYPLMSATAVSNALGNAIWGLLPFTDNNVAANPSGYINSIKSAYQRPIKDYYNAKNDADLQRLFAEGANTVGMEVFGGPAISGLLTNAIKPAAKLITKPLVTTIKKTSKKLRDNIRSIPNRLDMRYGSDNVYPVRSSQVEPVDIAEVADEAILSRVPQDTYAPTIRAAVNEGPIDILDFMRVNSALENGIKRPDMHVPYVYSISEKESYNKGIVPWLKDLKRYKPNQIKHIREYYSDPRTVEHMKSLGYTDDAIRDMQNIDVYYHPDLPEEIYKGTNVLGTAYNKNVPFVHNNNGRVGGIRNKTTTAHEATHVADTKQPAQTKRIFQNKAEGIFDTELMADVAGLDRQGAIDEIFAELGASKIAAGPKRLPTEKELEWALNNYYRIGEFPNVNKIKDRNEFYQKIYDLMNYIPAAAGAGAVGSQIINNQPNQEQ